MVVVVEVEQSLLLLLVQIDDLQIVDSVVWLESVH